MTVTLKNVDGYQIPHSDFLVFEKLKMLKLGMDQGLAMALIKHSDFGDKLRPAKLSFHMWSWIGVIVLVASVYWSFTSDWWWFLIGIVLWSFIWSANKKSLPQNVADAARKDAQLYSQILDLQGWLYEVKETELDTFVNYKK